MQTRSVCIAEIVNPPTCLDQTIYPTASVLWILAGLDPDQKLGCAIQLPETGHLQPKFW